MSTMEASDGEPVRKKQKTLNTFLGKQKTLDSFFGKQGDRVEDRYGANAPPIWSKIEGNGLNISQAVVIDAQESNRLFVQLENEVCLTLLKKLLKATQFFRLSISQAALLK